MNIPEQKSEMIIEIAKHFVGITDQNPLVSNIRKSVTGIDSKQAWCACFVWYCLDKTDLDFDIQNQMCFPHTNIHRAELVTAMWDKTSGLYKSHIPLVGSIVCWQLYDGLQPTIHGHTGIVTFVDYNAKVFKTIEGNSKPEENSTDITREGHGVFRHDRHFYPKGQLKILGFLRPWL